MPAASPCAARIPCYCTSPGRLECPQAVELEDSKRLIGKTGQRRVNKPKFDMRSFQAAESQAQLLPGHVASALPSFLANARLRGGTTLTGACSGPVHRSMQTGRPTRSAAEWGPPTWLASSTIFVKRGRPATSWRSRPSSAQRLFTPSLLGDAPPASLIAADAHRPCEMDSHGSCKATATPAALFPATAAWQPPPACFAAPLSQLPSRRR